MKIALVSLFLFQSALSDGMGPIAGWSFEYGFTIKSKYYLSIDLAFPYHEQAFSLEYATAISAFGRTKFHKAFFYLFQ